ncbi:MAG: hypothetical protein V1858_04580 [Candidatus Gottesmanbacteria bacterium]
MIKKTLIAIISLGLFLGGIILLVIRIPFWSLLLGLPSVQIGIILIIFAFDRLSHEEIKYELADVHQVPCALCGQPTFTQGIEVKGICSDCDKRLLKKMGKLIPS